MTEATARLDLLDFRDRRSQREISAVSKTNPAGPDSLATEIPELERRRLVAEGWSTESIECYEKFGHEAALLYPIITRGGRNFGAVATPMGQGSLVSVMGDTCRVLLSRGGGEKTRDFWTWDVRPYGKGRI